MKTTLKVFALKCEACGRVWIPRKVKVLSPARRCPGCGKAVAP